MKNGNVLMMSMIKLEWARMGVGGGGGEGLKGVACDMTVTIFFDKSRHHVQYKT